MSIMAYENGYAVGYGDGLAEAKADNERLRAALKELIESETDSARVHYGRYDRRSKSYIFNDDIWRESHEASFLMVRRAKAALGK